MTWGELLVAAGPAIALVLAAATAWPPGSPGSPGPGPRGAGPGGSTWQAVDDTVYAAADALTLLAVVLRAGLGPVEALEAVADRVGGPAGQDLLVVAAAHRWGEDPAAAWAHVGEVWRPAALAWQAALLAGAAPASLIEAAAERLRHDEDRRIEVSLQRAGVLLVLPLGLAFLPGFVCTTVVPVVLHLAVGLVGR